MIDENEKLVRAKGIVGGLLECPRDPKKFPLDGVIAGLGSGTEAGPTGYY